MFVSPFSIAKADHQRPLDVTVEMYGGDVLDIVFARSDKFLAIVLGIPDLRGHEMQPLFKTLPPQESLSYLTPFIEATADKADLLKLGNKNAQICINRIAHALRDAS